MTDISSDTITAPSGATRVTQDKIYEYVSVLDYVFSTDPSNDYTLAFRRALATGKNVFVPPSQSYYMVTDQITISTAGQVIFGETGGSRIGVDGNFNMSATSVFKITTACSERNSGFDGIEIFFAQPVNVTSRSQLIQYPYAIDAQGVTRLKFGHLKVAGGWNGLNLQGNCGGLIAECLEIGCYNQGIVAGDSEDWWNIGTLTFWPYGCNYRDIYKDSANCGAYFGRVDGLNIRTLNAFNVLIIISTSSGVAGFGSIGILSLDTSARLDFRAGNFNIASWYATSGTDTYMINVSGGAVALGVGRLLASTTSTMNAPIQIVGGEANFGPMICDSSSSNVPAVSHTGGFLLMDAPVFQHNGGNRTAPYVHCQAGRLSLRHPKFPDVGSSSGYAIIIDNDEWHDIYANQTVGWPVSFPSPRPLGTYVLQGVKV